MEYLSDEWFTAAGQALESLAPATTPARIRHRIGPGSNGHPATEFVLVLGDGHPRLERDGGPADVSLVQDHETAIGVRQGRIAALEAVQDGRIAVEGDPRYLIAAAADLREVDRVLSVL